MSFSELSTIYQLIWIIFLFPLPSIFLFMWIDRRNRQRFPGTIYGFSGLLLLLAFYITYLILTDSITLLAYLAHNARDLKTDLIWAYCAEAFFSTMQVVLYIISAIYMIKKSPRFPLLFVFTNVLAILLPSLDFILISGFQISKSADFSNIGHIFGVLFHLYYETKHVVGDLILPILCIFYIKISARVRNTFAP